MYHYVRDLKHSRYPEIKGLDFELFKNQIRYLKGNFNIVTMEDVIESINKIYEAAYSVRDFRTMQFLDWFIKEQGEEEKNADDNIKKYHLFAGDSKGLYMLDNEMKARVYVAPTLVL